MFVKAGRYLVIVVRNTTTANKQLMFIEKYNEVMLVTILCRIDR